MKKRSKEEIIKAFKRLGYENPDKTIVDFVVATERIKEKAYNEGFEDGKRVVVT